jgi:hypothetical protein
MCCVARTVMTMQILRLNRAYPLGYHCVGDAALGGRALPPSIEAAGDCTQDTVCGAYGEVGLVRVHESEDLVGVASLRPANQAVAFARMSRSC